MERSLLAAIKCLKDAKEEKVEINKLKEASTIVKDYANDHGLSSEHIFVISHVVASGTIGGNIGYSLIHNLIPENEVTEETILNILSKVLSNRCSNRIKAKLINWIVAVFDLSSSTDQLHCLYNQLFSLICYEVLGVCVCKLIALLTRKEDVNTFQLNRLLDIQDEIGNRSHLTMLFTVFKQFNPSLVTISSRRAKIKVSTASEIKWRELLLKFNNVTHSSADIILKKPIGMVANKEINAVNSDTHSLSSFQSLEDVVRYIGQLSYVNEHCASEVYLTKDFLISLLHISNDISLQIRLNFWLRSELSIKNIVSNDETTNWLLETLVKLTDLTNNFQSVTRDYVSQYLPFWNGRTQITYLSILISQLPLMDYSEIEEFVLSILYKLISVSPSPLFSCMIIEILRKLTSNFINFEIPRYCSLPESSKYYIDWKDMLYKLINFCDLLMSKCLSLHYDSTLVLMTSLRYYNSIMKALEAEDFDIFVIPSFSLIYKSLFSCSSTLVSMMCSAILQAVKKFKQMTMQNKIDETVHNQGVKLNTHIMEIFNTLWRHRAFDSTSNTVFKQIDVVSALEKHYDMCVPAATAFSLECHPAFIIINAFYALEMNLSESQLLEGKYITNDRYFEHMNAHGCRGLTELLTSIRKPMKN